MAIDVLGLVFAANPKTTIGGEVEVPLDAAVAVEHEFHNRVTTNPIEDGSEVADHVMREPDRVTVEGFVSDTPVEILGGVLGGNVSGLVGDIVGAEVRHVEAWRLLRQAFDTQALLTLVTTLGEYEDMVIESLSTQQSDRSAHALWFSMSLVKIVKASTSEGLLDQLLDVLPGGADQAAGVARRGQQAAQTPTAVQVAAAAGIVALGVF